MLTQTSPLIKLESVLSQAQPGDVIAYAGNGLDAKIIQWFTVSPYSHVAIVLDNSYPSPNRRDILIAEATSYTSVTDFREKKCRHGVQIHWLSHWLKSYQTAGDAFWVPLKQPLPSEQATQMQSWLWSLHEQQVPYSCRKGLSSWLARQKYFQPAQGRIQKKEPLSLFCSELVTSALKLADVLDPHLNPATQTPKDVMQLTCFHEPQRILLH